MEFFICIECSRVRAEKKEREKRGGGLVGASYWFEGLTSEEVLCACPEVLATPEGPACAPVPVLLEEVEEELLLT